MAKKKDNITHLSPKEIHEQLFACINCKLEGKCENILPFPINLCEKCEKYEKREFDMTI
jgi:hypothetical protein